MRRPSIIASIAIVIVALSSCKRRLSTELEWRGLPPGQHTCGYRDIDYGERVCVANGHVYTCLEHKTFDGCATSVEYLECAPAMTTNGGAP